MKPLNPALYSRLQALFGRVEVSNEGASFHASLIPEFDDETERTVNTVRVESSGEYYRVRCPYCDDRGKHLWVNHRFASKVKGYGRPLNFLAICYRRDCLAEYENRKDFIDKLNALHRDIAEPEILEGKPASLSSIVPGPGTILKLSDLPPSHEAIRYLLGRGFDPANLEERYDVGYCTESEFSLAVNRIYIPVYVKKELRFWQTRYPDDIDFKAAGFPKYFGCPGSHKADILYNSERAFKYNTGVIVEGVTDVWKIQKHAMCLFGKTISGVQFDMLVSVFSAPGRSLCLFLDNEAYQEESVKKHIRKLKRALPGKFAKIIPPEGKDPGSLDPKFCLRFIETEAAKQGLEVSWEKVKRETKDSKKGRRRRRLGGT